MGVDNEARLQHAGLVERKAWMWQRRQAARNISPFVLPLAAFHYRPSPRLLASARVNRTIHNGFSRICRRRSGALLEHLRLTSVARYQSPVTS